MSIYHDLRPSAMLLAPKGLRIVKLDPRPFTTSLAPKGSKIIKYNLRSSAWQLRLVKDFP